MKKRARKNKINKILILIILILILVYILINSIFNSQKTIMNNATLTETNENKNNNITSSDIARTNISSINNYSSNLPLGGAYSATPSNEELPTTPSVPQETPTDLLR